MTSTLITQKLKKAETDVSSLLDGVRCVIISYDLWMSKVIQEIFSMMAHYTVDHVRDHAHTRMPITTSNYGESLAVPVGNVINQFNLVSKLVGIASNSENNLARCKDILESTFDNTEVFDLERPIFVMECLAYVLANACKALAMDL